MSVKNLDWRVVLAVLVALVVGALLFYGNEIVAFVQGSESENAVSDAADAAQDAVANGGGSERPDAVPADDEDEETGFFDRVVKGVKDLADWLRGDGEDD